MTNDIKETEIVPELSKNREKRQFEFGHNIIALRDKQLAILAYEDFKKSLAAYLERQNWGNVFNELRDGDNVVFFSSPALEILKIKYLNDVVFGPQITDAIIAIKRKLLNKKMMDAHNQPDKNIQILFQDFKQDAFRIHQGMTLDLSKINQICEEINQEMTIIIENKLSAISELTTEQEDFKQKLANGGYRLTFGVTAVQSKSDSNLTNKYLAIQRAYSMSTVARSMTDKTQYGGEYSEAKILQELDNIQMLRGTILNKTITDKNGDQYQIFDNKGFLNRDLLRLVRKDKFICDPEQQVLYGNLRKYIKSLNLIDLLKSFTKEELENGALMNKINKNSYKARQLKEKGELSDETKKDITLAVEADARDPLYSSADVFHAEATSMPNVSYIAIDVLDVGLDQIRECEGLLINLFDITDKNEKINKFEEAATKAGDKTTEYLREVRRIIAEVVRKQMNISPDDKPILALVGGDELTLAIENDPKNKTRGQAINNLQFEIKKALRIGLQQSNEVRIIRTAMARSDKHLSSHDGMERKDLIQEHLSALKRVEKGMVIAKEIEEMERKMKRKKSGDVIIEIQNSDIKNFIKKIKTSNFDFIMQEDENALGEFIIVDNYGGSMRYTPQLAKIVHDYLC